ncbi:MAG TPA: hypothetical protein VKB88_31075 [Bryobacteraceae bacterium]|nr:hypothetical protein [Bryobacteraceae bacterium]
MKKITGLMAILVAAAAFAVPAMARDRDDYNNCNTPAYSYNNYTVARHDVRDVRNVRNVRHDARTDRGRFER